MSASAGQSIEGAAAATKVDSRLLLGTKVVRLFAYGLLSVALVMYLAELGFSDARIGALLTLTLLGDTLISLWMTTGADRKGRRKMLIAGALLMALAGVVFALSRDFFVLTLAATIGVISPSGNEVGPFLSIEQSALAQIVAPTRRTGVFAWYALVGSFAVALGAMAGGALLHGLKSWGLAPLTGYRYLMIGYGILGLALALLFTRLSRAIEVGENFHRDRPPVFLGLHRSRAIVTKLSVLFGLDAFAGGFVLQSLIAYWFYLRFGLDVARLGTILFGANVLAGVSALSASRLAARFGLIRTMVFTHMPSNVLLVLVPLMPNATLAVAVLWLRFSISQMDVPTRQAYVVSVVAPDERSAAAGVTGIARTIGVALSPLLVGPMLANASWRDIPFFLAGGLKLLYDVMLYRSFKTAESPTSST